MKMVIADKNYSTWSLRAWLCAKQSGIAFEEVLIRLNTAQTKSEIFKYSPSGKLPCLIDGDTLVWDSLAICEYFAEKKPSLWPKDRKDRGEARSIAAEIHSGFLSMRQDMPMKISSSRPYNVRSPDAESNISRIIAILESCLARFSQKGPFLFGDFTIVDAMFAPVVWRFLTYDVKTPEATQAWIETMLALPAMQEWKEGALLEAGEED